MIDPSKAVNIIGVGNMGAGMACNLLTRGWQVWVHDLEPQKVDFLVSKGAKIPVERAGAAPFLGVNYFPAQGCTVLCVVDAAQCFELLFGIGGCTPTRLQGLAQSMRPGHTVMLCPTIAPQDAQAISARLATSGIHCIDAPMSGGPVRASEGTMSLMIACAQAVFKQHETLLRDLSNKLFFISEQVGDAARTKLVNNLLAAVNLAGAAQAIALAERLGLDAAKTLDVIEQSSAQSWISSDRMHRALQNDFTPRAHISLLAKDTQLAMQMAQTADIHPSLGAQATAIFQAALAAGLAQEDDAALLKLFRAKFMSNTKQALQGAE